MELASQTRAEVKHFAAARAKTLDAAAGEDSVENV